MKLLQRLKDLFVRKEQVPTPVMPLEEQFSSPAEAFLSNADFWGREDLIFFPHFNAYGAFKYPVVKDILANNTDIGVSDVHLELNGIYFSLNEEQHQSNKRAAVNHLKFLSKQHLHEENHYSRELFDFFLGRIPLNVTIDLAERLIHPMVFINAMQDFDFIGCFPQLNIHHPDYQHEEAVGIIRDIFFDTSTLDKLLLGHLRSGGAIPPMMENFIRDIRSDKAMDEVALAGFYRSMLFSATESTASFICSLVRTISTDYPHFFHQLPEREELSAIANEVLRIHTPVPYIFRTVRKETEYAGKQLHVGDTVILFLGSANVDPNTFDNPLAIQLDRKERHLAFGRGPYMCIGQSASMRLALNFAGYMLTSPFVFRYMDALPERSVHNGMLRIPMNFSLHDKGGWHG